MLQLLGPSPAWHDAQGSHPLPNTLPGWTIAFLAVHGDWVSRDRLLTLLWPDSAAAEAQHNLRVDLHRVRSVLADWGLRDALETERRRVRLIVPTDIASSRGADDAAATPNDPGALLASMVFDGFPALKEWAALERAARAAAWRDDLLRQLDTAALDAATALKVSRTAARRRSARRGGDAAPVAGPAGTRPRPRCPQALRAVSLLVEPRAGGRALASGPCPVGRCRGARWRHRGR